MKTGTNGRKQEDADENGRKREKSGENRKKTTETLTRLYSGPQNMFFLNVYFIHMFNIKKENLYWNSNQPFSDL